jgi:hypothetical protein
MDLNNHFDFTSQGRRPTASQIASAWKKAGKPDTFSVQYGETEAEFTALRSEGFFGDKLPVRWVDSGNGCRGVDRSAVIKLLETA